MGLLNLLIKVRANNDDYNRKMDELDRKTKATAQSAVRNFRTAFTTFFSISALRTLILQTAQWARDFENIREEVGMLGMDIDEEVIKGAQRADAAWQQFNITLKMGLSQALPYFADAVDWIVLQSQKAAAILGVLFDKIVSTGPALKDILMLGIQPWNAKENIKKLIGDIKNISPVGTWVEIGAQLAGIEIKAAQQRAARDRYVEWHNQQLLDKLNKKDKDKKTTVDSPLVSTVSKATDKLAAIGGFRALRANDRLITLSQQQVDRLDMIRDNTESLKGGII